MQINSQSSFYNVPGIDIQRSSFVRPSGLKTTFNSSYLVPIFWDEVLPGDTWQMDMSFVSRMQTPLFPVMDEANIEVFWFFVPNRLVWDHWKEFMGENNTSYWTADVDYSVPQLRISVDMNAPFDKNDLATYLGIPLLPVDGLQFQHETYVNHLPFRSYVKVWNDWFRDENVMSPAYLNTGDGNFDAMHGYDDPDGYDTRSAFYGGGLLKVSKYHDLFTSALPSPQKGDPVAFDFAGTALVKTAPDSLISSADNPMLWFVDGPTFNVATSDAFSLDARSCEIQSEPNIYKGVIDSSGGNIPYPDEEIVYSPANLYVDGSSFGSFSINDLRFAFQLQRLLERDARGGTRYIELLKSHFGVTSPDARLQRSEYLGGIRVPVNMDQVLQTSATNEVSPQGNTAAFSLTADKDHCFTHSFTEHGIILGLACVRQVHTYQNGISRLFKRKDKFDYYWPALANIGEQPIRNEEIFAWSNENGVTPPSDTFGYQEAWYEYRYKPSMVTGEMASNVQQSLDVWHYADNFDQTPILSEGFINETDVNIERTLAVQENYHQFLFDAYFSPKLTRPMPLYSVPGLIDHF